MEWRCEELLWHCTGTAGMAVARHRGEPLRLRCDKESEGYARTCKRHCPQGNETDATEKYSPALAKRIDEQQGLGHAKDGIGVDMQGLLWNGRDRTSTGKEAHWRAMEVQRWKRIEGRWKCIARATERQSNARQGHGMDSKRMLWQGAEEPRRRRKGKAGQRVEMARRIAL